MYFAFACLKTCQDHLSKTGLGNTTCKKESEEVSYKILHTPKDTL